MQLIREAARQHSPLLFQVCDKLMPLFKFLFTRVGSHCAIHEDVLDLTVHDQNPDGGCGDITPTGPRGTAVLAF